MTTTTDPTISAPAYTAGQCPVCDEWIYLAAPPYAEGDPTKPERDHRHLETHHPETLEREENPATGVVVTGFPMFTWNDEPVEARFEGLLPATHEYVVLDAEEGHTRRVVAEGRQAALEETYDGASGIANLVVMGEGETYALVYCIDSARVLYETPITWPVVTR